MYLYQIVRFHVPQLPHQRKTTLQECISTKQRFVIGKFLNRQNIQNLNLLAFKLSRCVYKVTWYWATCNKVARYGRESRSITNVIVRDRLPSASFNDNVFSESSRSSGRVTRLIVEWSRRWTMRRKPPVLMSVIIRR